MKTIALREVKQQLSACVESAQKDYILITKHGRPAALIKGVEGYDLEDIVLMTNRGFWSMLRRRRAEKAIPWRKAKRKLAP